MGMNGTLDAITLSSDDVVIKSPNDRRLYRLIRLQNGLQALLVHYPEIYPQGPPKDVVANVDDEEKEDDDDDDDEDEDADGEEGDDYDDNEVEEKEGSKDAAQTKKAAAAMCVGIGSFFDPFEAQGLAHFLEHMLFMGSEEFPDENEIFSVLHFSSCKNGGHGARSTCSRFRFYKVMLAVFNNFNAILPHLVSLK